MNLVVVVCCSLCWFSIIFSAVFGNGSGDEDAQTVEPEFGNETATSVAMSCLGEVVAFASRGPGLGSVWVRNETLGLYERRQGIPAGAIAVSCDGRTVYAGNDTASTIFTATPSGYSVAQTWPHPGSLVSAACSIRAAAFADPQEGKTFFYAPPSSGGGPTAPRRVFSGFRNATSLSLSCDGSLLAVGVRETGTVTVLRTSDGSELAQLRDDPATGFGASVSLAGPSASPVLAVGCPDIATVRVYQCGKEACEGLDYVELQSLAGFGGSVSLSGNAAVLAASGQGETISLRWDINKRRYMVEGETAQIDGAAVAATRNGNAFAVAGAGAFISRKDAFAVNCPEC